MARYWHYYDENGVKCGPVHSSALRVLASQGVVKPDTTLETESGKQAPAGRIEGLTFAETTAQTESPAPDADPLALDESPASANPASLNPAPEPAPVAPPPTQSTPRRAVVQSAVPQQPASPSKVGVFLSKAWAWFMRQPPKIKAAIIAGFVILMAITGVQETIREQRRADEIAHQREIYNSPEARAERAAKLKALRDRLVAERKAKRLAVWQAAEVTGDKRPRMQYLLNTAGESAGHCAECKRRAAEIVGDWTNYVEQHVPVLNANPKATLIIMGDLESRFVEAKLPTLERLDSEYLCGANLFGVEASVKTVPTDAAPSGNFVENRVKKRMKHSASAAEEYTYIVNEAALSANHCEKCKHISDVVSDDAAAFGWRFDAVLKKQPHLRPVLLENFQRNFCTSYHDLAELLDAEFLCGKRRPEAGPPVEQELERTRLREEHQRLERERKHAEIVARRKANREDRGQHLDIKYIYLVGELRGSAEHCDICMQKSSKLLESVNEQERKIMASRGHFDLNYMPVDFMENYARNHYDELAIRLDAEYLCGTKR